MSKMKDFFRKNARPRALLALGLFLGLSCTAYAGPTLDAVKQHGSVKCGFIANSPGFAIANKDGRVEGMDADFCRGVAAAIFGDAEKVEFVPLQVSQRFMALKTKQVDVLSASVTDSLSREADLGSEFTPLWYLDHQDIMLSKTSKVKSVKDLANATICALAGSDSLANLNTYLRAQNLKLNLKINSFQNVPLLAKALDTGRCDGATMEQSYLAVIRASTQHPDGWRFLGENISMISISPLVSGGVDRDFELIVKWVRHTFILADELGINSKNVDELRKSSQSPPVRFLLGTEGKAGEFLHLNPDFGYQIIKQVGSYQEVFARGPGKVLGLPQGRNKPASQGGWLAGPALY